MLSDFPVFGEQPCRFRFEIVRDFDDYLMVWDNDEALMVPDSRCTYANKIVAFRMLRRCTMHVMPLPWTAYVKV